jgi:hypothetical protein
MIDTKTTADTLAIRSRTVDKQNDNMRNENAPAIEEGRLSEVQAPGPINTLPNEILSHILSYLDAPRDLSAGLLDEPRFDLTQSKVSNLKAASCVSKQWRQVVFPMLFKHPQFVEDQDYQPMLDGQIKPFLEFARSNSLDTIIESFTLVVKNAKVYTKGKNSPDPFSSFWMTLFDLLDPPELLIIAPVEALAKLTACHILRGDAWNFDCPCRKFHLEANLFSSSYLFHYFQGFDSVPFLAVPTSTLLTRNYRRLSTTQTI